MGVCICVSAKIPISIARHTRTWRCLALNMWPSTKEISDVNIYEPHEYEVRIRWVGEEKWIGIVSVDGEKKCQMEIPPFGPLEIQIWSDGYLLKTSPW